MNVAGIDLSSRAIHIVLLDFDTNHATDHDFHAKGDTPFERARDMRRVFPRHSWWEDHGVALVGLSSPTTIAQAEGLTKGQVS